MSTNYHTPILVGADANAATVNTPLAQLDTAIGAIDTAAGGAQYYIWPASAERSEALPAWQVAQSNPDNKGVNSQLGWTNSKAYTQLVTVHKSVKHMIKLVAFDPRGGDVFNTGNELNVGEKAFFRGRFFLSSASAATTGVNRGHDFGGMVECIKYSYLGIGFLYQQTYQMTNQYLVAPSATIALSVQYYWIEAYNTAAASANTRVLVNTFSTEPGILIAQRYIA